MEKYFEVKAVYPDNALVTERFYNITAARQYLRMIRKDTKQAWIKETCSFMSRIERLEMKTRIIVQKFVNKAKSGLYNVNQLAIEYFDTIGYCREVYGICPNQCGMLYDRLPETVQDAICRLYDDLDK